MSDKPITVEVVGDHIYDGIVRAIGTQYELPDETQLAIMVTAGHVRPVAAPPAAVPPEPPESKPKARGK